jgi:spoIIIJ-associated protein
MDPKQVERGQQWLRELLRLTGVNTPVDSRVTEVAGEAIQWLVIVPEPLTPEQISGLTGPSGTVLDSIQYLTNAILNLGQPEASQGAFTVELDGYRLRRYAELKAMTDAAAVTVRATGEDCELKSLSSAERRQVHTLLKEFADLSTFSRGQEPDRRLVISLTSAIAE